MVTTRTRLTIDVTPELRRRIKMAAAARDLSVRQYVVELLEENVREGPAVRTLKGRLVTGAMIEELDRTREAVMRGRVFSDDSADLINEARAQRSEEL